jgi:hypothetical protein
MVYSIILRVFRGDSRIASYVSRMAYGVPEDKPGLHLTAHPMADPSAEPAPGERAQHDKRPEAGVRRETNDESRATSAETRRRFADGPAAVEGCVLPIGQIRSTPLRFAQDNYSYGHHRDSKIRAAL